ncbi:MAG: thioredoxin domain-containing protein [Elusimicrobia bacterium]|nr:thioredoxin domain-containing protein [Elusimicrobiota bacterium]
MVTNLQANHLIHEKSPYLLQHAYNPVDWYPWGEEAFQKARREDKPIFLSIGYSTCHWCHVMERESFSNPRIAEILNKHFVSIKLDREERPDVDRIYMTAVQAMTGSGGWPLSVWLTSDLKPFFGGTYFPPDASWGRPGFSQILEQLSQLWKKDRGKIVSSSNELNRVLVQGLAVRDQKGSLDPAALENGFKSYQESYDPSQGGFGGAPKFPMPVNHNFILRYYARSKSKQALEMVTHTLRKMAKGGIYDHIGGGFHRYSTDEKWHVPHFEKMLYDNAQIIINYLEAYQITKEEVFAQTTRETLEYVLRDMSHPEGGFYSAEDADSLPADARGAEKKEGAFYVWEKSEILEVLGKEKGDIFSTCFGVEENGKNILLLAHAMKEGQEAKRKLFEVRSKRPRPHRDDKILTSWNGLMISALAKAHRILGDPQYLKAGEKAAWFIQEHLYDAKDKRLYRRWRAGERKIFGMADDYAFLVQGILDLYEASFDIRWLDWAMELTEEQNRLFYDVREGGFYMTAPGHDKNLIVRAKEDSDNVEPSASSVAALNLLRLAQFADRGDFREMAQKTLALFGTQMAEQPRSLPQMLVALNFFLSKPIQVVIAGKPDAPDTQAMLRQVSRKFMPNKILILADGGKNQKVLAGRLPFLKGVVPIQGKATAYVCVNYACELPTSDLKKLDLILHSI